jgi:hypothetical protein
MSTAVSALPSAPKTPVGTPALQPPMPFQTIAKYRDGLRDQKDWKGVARLARQAVARTRAGSPCHEDYSMEISCEINNLVALKELKPSACITNETGM